MTIAGRLARPSRYAVSGAICALCHNLIMIGADTIGVHYAAATFLSFWLVGALGFFLHVRFTFAARASWPAYWRFMGGLSFGLPLSLVIMFLLCDGAGLPVAIAAPIATVALFVVNYILARWAILYRRQLPQ